MLESDIIRCFQRFGTKIGFMMILTLILFIFGIVGWFLIGIFLYLLIMIPFFCIFIVSLSALRELKKANIKMKDTNLIEFQFKLMISFILTIIGCLSIWGVLFVIFLIDINIGLKLTSLDGFVIFWLLVIQSIILITIAAVHRYNSWKIFYEFLSTQEENFPPKILTDAKDGAKYCKNSAILDMTIILWIVGELLRFYGYYKLSSLKNISIKFKK